jgi:hypothetical protein
MLEPPTAPGKGTWMNNQTWAKSHGLASSAMAAANLDGNAKQDLVVDFAPYGVWTFKNNQTWEKLHDLPARHVIRCK